MLGAYQIEWLLSNVSSDCARSHGSHTNRDRATWRLSSRHTIEKGTVHLTSLKRQKGPRWARTGASD